MIQNIPRNIVLMLLVSYIYVKLLEYMSETVLWLNMVGLEALGVLKGCLSWVNKLPQRLKP